jgi:hypothetical protein
MCLHNLNEDAARAPNALGKPLVGGERTNFENKTKLRTPNAFFAADSPPVGLHPEVGRFWLMIFVIFRMQLISGPHQFYSTDINLPYSKCYSLAKMILRVKLCCGVDTIFEGGGYGVVSITGTGQGKGVAVASEDKHVS